MSEIKLCKDCKHRRPLFYYWLPFISVAKVKNRIENKYFSCASDNGFVNCWERKPTLLERVKGWLK